MFNWAILGVPLIGPWKFWRFIKLDEIRYAPCIERLNHESQRNRAKNLLLLSWESKGTPPLCHPPPINKALLRDYENPLGGYLRFPWFYSVSIKEKQQNLSSDLGKSGPSFGIETNLALQSYTKVVVHRQVWKQPEHPAARNRNQKGKMKLLKIVGDLMDFHKLESF